MVPKARATIPLAAALTLGWTLASTGVTAAEGPETLEAPVASISVDDITGDGVAEEVHVVLDGEEHLVCSDGAAGRPIWTSSCYIRSWGRKNPAGNAIGPMLYDADDDGRRDLIFQAEGCDAIVALNLNTGSLLWSIPLDQIVGGRNSLNPDLYRGRDLLLAGDRVLVGVTSSEKLRGEEAKAGGALVALNPRDGKVVWRAPLPMVPRKVFKNTEMLNGVREASGSEGILSFGVGAGSGGGVSFRVPVGGGAPTWGVSPGQYFALYGLADTARMMIIGGLAIYAGLREIHAVRLADGKTAWSWRIQAQKALRNAGLLERDGTLFVVGREPGGVGVEGRDILLFALDVADGRLLWQAEVEISQRTWDLTLRVSDKVVLEYVPLEKDEPPRRVEMDRATGKVTSGATGG